MKTTASPTVHRCMGKDGTIRVEDSGQDRFLQKLYTSFYGRVLLKVLTQPGFSKAAGAFLDRRASRFLIRPFIEKNHMDMRPYVKRPYRSFNDFFTREILPTERMIDCDPIHLVSPCDGKISIYPLDETAEFAVKGSVYTLERILKNPSWQKGMRAVMPASSGSVWMITTGIPTRQTEKSRKTSGFPVFFTR